MSLNLKRGPFRSPRIGLMAAALSATFMGTALHSAHALNPFETPSSGSGSVAYTSSTPRITAFDVNRISRVEPGAELSFRLTGTPGAQASLRIDGAQRDLVLRETASGVYEGAYVVSTRDRIDPNARVNANLRVGNRIGTAVLDEPLVSGYAYPGNQSAVLPVIQSFTVSRAELPPSRRDGGGYAADQRQELKFELRGTPEGRASVQIPGARVRSVRLEETFAGQYEGSYVVDSSERIQADRPIRARLRVGNQNVTAASNDLLRAGYVQSNSALCVDCGRVRDINQLETDGDGNLLGTAAGGVLGAVLGSQVGKGDGRIVGGVAGAVGGALLGREIQKRTGKQNYYEIVVDMDDGSQRRINVADRGILDVGTPVQFQNGELRVINR